MKAKRPEISTLTFNCDISADYDLWELERLVDILRASSDFVFNDVPEYSYALSSLANAIEKNVDEYKRKRVSN